VSFNIVGFSQVIKHIPEFHPRHHHRPPARSDDVVLAQLSSALAPTHHEACKKDTPLCLGQPWGLLEENHLRHNNKDMTPMPSECACSLKFKLGPFQAMKGMTRTMNCKLAFHGICAHLLSTQPLGIIIHVIKIILVSCRSLRRVTHA
jgi:hypothetical protein